jgi:hypothetical protein
MYLKRKVKRMWARSIWIKIRRKWRHIVNMAMKLRNTVWLNNYKFLKKKTRGTKMKGTKNKTGRKDLKLKRDPLSRGSLREMLQQGAWKLW